MLMIIFHFIQTHECFLVLNVLYVVLLALYDMEHFFIGFIVYFECLFTPMIVN